jgi:hypothetical protein
MKKTKLFSTRFVLFRVAFFLLISLSLFLFFGCQEEPEEDLSISEITIYNIPASIPINNGSGSNTAFKIYLNASNSQKASAPPVAKGVAKLGTPSGGKHTVTIKLQNPNKSSDKNPNTNTGPWSGTANFFSVMISPQSVTTDGINAVWIKAGLTLNKGKQILIWDSLMDFRKMGFTSESQALYDGIILEDSEISH